MEIIISLSIVITVTTILVSIGLDYEEYLDR